MKQEYQVILEKEDFLYGKVRVFCENSKTVFANMRTISSKLKNEYNIEEKNILGFKIVKNGKEQYAEIEYCKVRLTKLTQSKGIKEQIIATLKYLGYREEEIRNIEWKKKYNVDEGDEMTWRVEIPETKATEIYASKYHYELKLSDVLSKFLETNITVSLY